MTEEEEFEFRHRLEQEKAMQLSMQEAEPSTGQKVLAAIPGAAKRAVTAPFNAIKDITTDPRKLQQVAGPLLPIVGGLAAGAPGAAGGEFLRQMTGTAVAPETVPETALGRAASVMGAGILQEPKMLNAIPGVPKVADMAAKLAAKTGRGLAKVGQALSGAREVDLREAAKKGLSTYTAPSLESAGAKYFKALDKLPGEKVASTLVEHIESAIAPEGSSGSKFLLNMGKRLDAGELIGPRDALKAKQALDDVIDTVPVWQGKRRGKLFDLKRTFDEILTSQSGKMKAASNEYRSAILKNNLTKPLPVNKHGEYSRLAPMLATLAGGLGGAHGGAKEGAMGGLGYLLATSPLAMGGAAAIGGSTGKGLMKLAENPAIRQTLLGVLQKLNQKKQKNAE